MSRGMFQWNQTFSCSRPKNTIKKKNKSRDNKYKTFYHFLFLSSRLRMAPCPSLDQTQDRPAARRRRAMRQTPPPARSVTGAAPTAKLSSPETAHSLISEWKRSIHQGEQRLIIALNHLMTEAPRRRQPAVIMEMKLTLKESHRLRGNEPMEEKEEEEEVKLPD